MRLGARLPCNLLERFNYSQQEYYNMLSKVLFGNFLLSLFQLWFIYVNEGLILKFWILWTDLKDVFLKCLFALLNLFGKDLQFTLFLCAVPEKKIPLEGGGSFFGGPEGCFCGFIAFWKLRCFPKSTKTLFLASLNLFERRYFAIFIATLRLLFLVFITSLILKGFRRIHQWMMQTLFMIGIWIKRT